MTIMRSIFDLLKETVHDWQEDKAARLAAALAYYTAFSIAPLLLIAIVIAGAVFGEEAARGQIMAQLQGLLGPEAAAAIETAIENAAQTGGGLIPTVIGVGALIWSATNVFAQLQDALNTIWEVRPDPEAGIMAQARQRLLSMTMVLGIGFLLLVSLILSTALSALGAFLGGLLPGAEIFWQVVDIAFSFTVITLLFAAIFKVLPDAIIEWRDVWVGAAVTALLFVVGEFLIGLYLGNAAVGSTYGAAGALLVLLVWVYFSAQILFFGAEFTQVYARRHGSRIVPAPHAVPLTAEAREQQGIPRDDDEPRAKREEKTG